MLVEKRHDLHENDIQVSQIYHIVQPIAQCVVGKKQERRQTPKVTAGQNVSCVF